MNKMRYTYYEDGVYWAVVTTPSGHEYYAKHFKSRSGAYRYAKRENKRFKQAQKSGMMYNPRYS